MNYIAIANSRNLPEPVEIHSDDVYGIGTNEILKSANTYDLNLKDLKPDLIGNHETSLENSFIKFNVNSLGVQDNSNYRNLWIQPKPAQVIEKSSLKTFPCRKIYNVWNPKSIKSTDNETSECYGINSSCHDRRVVGGYNPTLHELPRDNLGLLGMFDLASSVANTSRMSPIAISGPSMLNGSGWSGAAGPTRADEK